MTNQSTSWTIMVYISADDVLANFAVESLKLLRDAAGDGIVVVAEFDANQGEDARVYHFDGQGPKVDSSSIENNRIPSEELRGLTTIRNPVDMTRPETLTQFIDYATQKSKTERYCLVLWGHGTELLLDENRRFAPPKESESEATKGPIRRYLTYSNLKKALRDTKLAKGLLGPDHPKSICDAKSGGRKQTLDILGIDACSMCMVEVASELQDCVDYMVASQADVPDTSFPYEKILSGLKGDGIRNDVRKVCKMIPALYGQAFQDYIATPATGVKEITLASLDLTRIHTITDPLTRLASALLTSTYDESMRKKIISARSRAQDFVFGIFVDLCDFCEQMESELGPRSITDTGLASSCEAICEAIKLREDGCVVENRPDVKQNRSHGLSIYFPYRTEDKTENVEEALAKGGTRQPLKGGTRQPLKERIARIEELEADFAKLDKFRHTRWDQFIKHGWSFILVNEVPLELDKYYSAEQVAANLASLYQSQTAAKAAGASGADYEQRPAV